VRTIRCVLGGSGLEQFPSTELQKCLSGSTERPTNEKKPNREFNGSCTSLRSMAHTAACVLLMEWTYCVSDTCGIRYRPTTKIHCSCRTASSVTTGHALKSELAVAATRHLSQRLRRLIRSAYPSSRERSHRGVAVRPTQVQGC
jgi:hypothetical protein